LGTGELIDAGASNTRDPAKVTDAYLALGPVIEHLFEAMAIRIREEEPARPPANVTEVFAGSANHGRVEANSWHFPSRTICEGTKPSSEITNIIFPKAASLLR